jgi:hypothetical protein
MEQADAKKRRQSGIPEASGMYQEKTSYRTEGQVLEEDSNPKFGSENRDERRKKMCLNNRDSGGIPKLGVTSRGV